MRPSVRSSKMLTLPKCTLFSEIKNLAKNKKVKKNIIGTQRKPKIKKTHSVPSTKLMTGPLKEWRKTKSEPLIKTRRNEDSGKAIVENDAHYYLLVKDQDTIQQQRATGNITDAIVSRCSPKRSPYKIAKTNTKKNHITNNKINVNNATKLYKYSSQSQFTNNKHNIRNTTTKTNSKYLMSVSLGSI